MYVLIKPLTRKSEKKKTLHYNQITMLFLVIWIIAFCKNMSDSAIVFLTQ
jgi:hypothetical protein